MRKFATNDQANYYSGITSITVNGKNVYELKGKFLDDLHKNAFSGALWDYWKLRSDEIEPTNLEETDHDEEQEIEWPTCSWREDGYCNGGNLPGVYIVGNTLRYQDLEWYDAVKVLEYARVIITNYMARHM
ncbi:hypothetical protein Tco_0348832 [Tanacetum coccineum]